MGIARLSRSYLSLSKGSRAPDEEKGTQGGGENASYSRAAEKMSSRKLSCRFYACSRKLVKVWPSLPIVSYRPVSLSLILSTNPFFPSRPSSADTRSRRFWRGSGLVLLGGIPPAPMYAAARGGMSIPAQMSGFLS